MIVREDFVTYNQAVKLKELGFDCECRNLYYGENATVVDQDEHKKLVECWTRRNSNTQNDRFSAPTLAYVQKWLRDIKQTEVFVHRVESGVYIWIIYGRIENIISNEQFYEFEDALSAGIDRALELLKRTI